MLGIEIGNFNIKLIETNKKGDFNRIKKNQRTPVNSIYNGKISDVNSIADDIKNLLKKNNIKDKTICFTISSSHNIIREIKLPKMKEEEIRTALSYEVEQYIPDISQYVYDYRFLGDSLDGDNFVRVMIAASPKEIIYDYVKLSELLKLNIEAIDVYSNSLFKAFKKLVNLDGTVVIVDIGSNLTNLTVFENKSFIFSRPVDFGGNEFTFKIANELNIDFDKAEEYKLQNNILLSDDEHILNLRKEFENSLDNLIAELSRIFDFYSSLYHKTIEKVYLIGGTSKLFGIKEYLEAFLKIPIIIPDNQEYIYFLPAYGCVLRGE